MPIIVKKKQYGQGDSNASLKWLVCWSDIHCQKSAESCLTACVSDLYNPSETSTNLIAAEGHGVRQVSMQHIDELKKSLITNHQAVSFLLWLIEWVFRQNTNKWILTGPFMGAIKGYGHPKVKWSPPPCYGWLPLSLWHHISQQMAVTLHFNKFSPWQGFISSIIHLFSNSFHIISCHSTHPWRQRDRGRIRWLFLFRPNNTSV